MPNKLSYAARNPLAELGVGLRTELIKVKRTAMPWMAVLGPLALCGLIFLIGTGDAKLFERAKHDPWAFYTQLHSIFLTFMFLPIYLALLPTQVFAAEHNSNSWKMLSALPTPRSALFVSKFVFMLLSLLVSIITLLLGIYLGGQVLVLLDKQPLLAAPFDWGYYVAYFTDLYVACLPMLAIHHWLSYRYKSFGIAIGVAILGMVSANVVMQGWEYAWLHPYTQPMIQTFMLAGRAKPVWYTLPAVVSLLMLVPLLALGYWDIHRRPVR